jgi:hypothetical protein
VAKLWHFSRDKSWLNLLVTHSSMAIGEDANSGKSWTGKFLVEELGIKRF